MISPTTPRLTAIPFDTEITKLTERFTGREWVFEEINNWLKDRDERFFVLTGEAGVGKSAIAESGLRFLGKIFVDHLKICS